METNANNTNNNNAIVSTIPNHVFDMEYSTQRRKEYLFLKDNGFIPTYVKENKTYNVKTYKYKKTPELFEKVAEFYRQDMANKQAEAVTANKQAQRNNNQRAPKGNAQAQQTEDATTTIKVNPANLTEAILGLLGVKVNNKAQAINQ